jgi:hypothetical protein
VQMQILSGDAGGLIFRTNSSLTNFYRFSMDKAKQRYDLIVCKACTSDQDVQHVGFLINSNNALSIQLNQTYTLTVIAVKDLFYLFVNGQFLTKTPDGTAQSGELGVYAFEFGNPTRVVFSNMKVWAL